MSAGERTSAQTCVARQRVLLDQLADRTKPPVLQLAHIELSARCDVLRPAEKDIACRLHDALSLDHPLALMALEFRRQPFEHRFSGLLDLQKQRRSVAAHV